MNAAVAAKAKYEKPEKRIEKWDRILGTSYMLSTLRTKSEIETYLSDEI